MNDEAMLGLRQGVPLPDVRGRVLGGGAEQMTTKEKRLAEGICIWCGKAPVRGMRKNGVSAMGMQLGSLFDGNGGFPLAGEMCGIEPVWVSEIEPYPIAVTRYRFPQIKHLGSVVRVSGCEQK